MKNNLTILECINGYEKEGKVLTINDGMILSFVEEKSNAGND